MSGSPRHQGTQSQRRTLNLRFGKRFPLGRSRISVDFEMFNLLNSNAATSKTFAAGPSFDYTTGVLPPRVARFGATFTF